MTKWLVNQTWQQPVDKMRAYWLHSTQRENVRSFESVINLFIFCSCGRDFLARFFFVIFFKLLAIFPPRKKTRVISLRTRSLFERSGSDNVAVVRAVTATMGNAHVMNRQAHKASAATNYSAQISSSITLLATLCQCSDSQHGLSPILLFISYNW